ncbi:MAG: glycosyltransferase family 2 protein [Acidobacteriota bacterium]
MRERQIEALRQGDAVDVVLVHYRTPDLLLESVEALRRDGESSGLQVRPVVADNGSTPRDRERFEAAGLSVLWDGENGGYSAGVNRGASAGRAPWVVVMNPDVLVEPGCLGALIEALREGADCVGPRFFWDRQQTLLLPPNERRGLFQELLSLQRFRSAAAGHRHRRRWRRHARRCWQATGPISCFELSGALLAFPRSVWERVGPFDEGYRLYFEETEWLLRLRRRGLCARYVPSAHAVHLYNRSAAAEPHTARWFQESRERYLHRAHGSWVARCALAAEARWIPSPQDLAASVAGAAGQPLDGPYLEQELLASIRGKMAKGETLWLEISPAPLGVPAAAVRFSSGEQSWRLPEETQRSLEAGEWSLRLVGDTGPELFRGTFQVS